jgi:hypothetical protein
MIIPTKIHYCKTRQDILQDHLHDIHKLLEINSRAYILHTFIILYLRMHILLKFGRFTGWESPFFYINDFNYLQNITISWHPADNLQN